MYILCISMYILTFDNDQILIYKNEDGLHRALHQLDLKYKKYSMSISTQKTKAMDFRRVHPTRTKISTDSQQAEFLSRFSYLD